MAYASTQRVRQVPSGLRKYSRGCATRKSLFINHFQKIHYQKNSLKFQLNIQRKNIKFDRISKLIACSYEMNQQQFNQTVSFTTKAHFQGLKLPADYHLLVTLSMLAQVV